MSLKYFHVVFIAASLLLAFAFGVWGVREYSDGAGVGPLLLGLGSIACGCALTVYLAKFHRNVGSQLP